MRMVRSTISNQIAKNFPSRRLRLLVESVLEQPIWSTWTDFEARQRLARNCGFDPFTATMPQLKFAASALKLRGRSRDRHKAKLIALLELHFKNLESSNSDAVKPT
jgi:hypothetical protein